MHRVTLLYRRLSTSYDVQLAFAPWVTVPLPGKSLILTMACEETDHNRFHFKGRPTHVKITLGKRNSTVGHTNSVLQRKLWHYRDDTDDHTAAVYAKAWNQHRQNR